MFVYKSVSGFLVNLNRPNRILLLGNCHTDSIGTILRAMNEHVACATRAGKSCLLTVLGEIKDQFTFFDYFPSYELCTTQRMNTDYYEDDARPVKETGGQGNMSLFLKALS